MRELGEYLKQMRETQGLSIHDVCEKLKIREKYIIALEESNFEELPPEVYVRGYIKNYGVLLGADLEDLYLRYEESKPKKAKVGLFQRNQTKSKPASKKMSKKSKKSGSSQDKKNNNSEKHSFYSTLGKSNDEIDDGGLKPKHLVIGLIAIILIIIMVYVIRINTNKPNIPVGRLPDNSVPGVESQVVEMPFSTEELLQEVILPLGDINPTWAIGRAESLSISIIVRQETWVRIEADYRPVHKGTIRPGQNLKFKAKNSFYMTMQKPELFAMTINGFNLIPGEEFRRVVGAPTNATAIEVEISRANITKYLEGMTEITLPSYMPSIPAPESLVAMQARQAESEQPPVVKPKPRRSRPKKNTTTTKPTNTTNSPATLKPRTVKPKPTETENPNTSSPPALKPRGSSD